MIQCGSGQHNVQQTLAPMMHLRDQMPHISPRVHPHEWCGLPGTYHSIGVPLIELLSVEQLSLVVTDVGALDKSARTGKRHVRLRTAITRQRYDKTT